MLGMFVGFPLVFLNILLSSSCRLLLSDLGSVQIQEGSLGLCGYEMYF